MRIGILLAAGRARRMGRTKQLLDWPTPRGRQPLVAAAYDAVAWACDAMVVVLGHDATRVDQALGTRPYTSVTVDPNGEMFASLRTGLNAAQRTSRAAHFLIHLADHPEVARATLERLLQEAAASPDRAVIPEYAGRGGHPVLIPALLASRLLRYDGPGGLRQYWADHPRDCLRLPVDDPAVVLDVDTPADYRRGRGGRIEGEGGGEAE